jgi:hypothetical protein
MTSLEPGMLLSAGTHRWLVVLEWIPQPETVPAALADRPCPVCGAALKLAPVCQCVCQRYAHLEAPDEPNNKNALNCFLRGPCGLCGRIASLEPVLVPEPHDKLLDRQGLGTWNGEIA